MRGIRFSIGRAMLGLGLFAINLGLIRALLTMTGSTGLWAALLVVGVMPMADVLLVVAYLGRERGGLRPFWRGFAVGGLLAMLAVAAACVAASRWVQDLLNGPSRWILVVVVQSGLLPTAGGSEYLIARDLLWAVASLLLPQLLLAGLAGAFAARYRIVRRDRGAAPALAASTEAVS